MPGWLVPAAAAGTVALVVLWAAIRGFHSHAGPQPPIVAQPASRPSSAAAAQAAATPAPAAAVLHEEVPAISHRTRESIHGQIKVVVRVAVDRSGNVVGENIEARGSSRYFAHLAEDAAKKWKFAPADNQAPREWLVQFDYSRSGVVGHAEPQIKK
jgi:outer membrane biosynthesis protein TonB